MHNRVNELENSEELLEIIAAVFMSSEYEYKPIEVVNRYEHKMKKP